MKNNKIPIAVALICILQYANQGISSLPSQALYYLTRETWNLSATMIGLVGFVISLAWYLKIVFAYFVDANSDKNSYYLKSSYVGLILAYLYIIFFGLNLITLIITGLIINISISIADIIVDKKMVIAEHKHKLKGRLQAIQWTALGVAGLLVSIGGAWIAHKFPIHLDYKIAYGLALIVPIIMLYYLSKHCKEKKVNSIRGKFIDIIKANIVKLKSRKLLIGLLFVAFFQFCPSFGTALMIQAREVLMVDKLFLGYVGATGTVLGVVGYILYYKWAYKFPLKKLLYFMIILTAVDNLCYLYLPNKYFLIIYSILFSAFSGIAFMTLLAVFVKIIPKGNEAFFYALVTSVSNFFGRLGSVVGGIIYDNLGYYPNILISAGFTLLCLIFIPYLEMENS